MGEFGRFTCNSKYRELGLYGSPVRTFWEADLLDRDSAFRGFFYIFGTELDSFLVYHKKKKNNLLSFIKKYSLYSLI